MTRARFSPHTPSRATTSVSTSNALGRRRRDVLPDSRPNPLCRLRSTGAPGSRCLLCCGALRGKLSQKEKPRTTGLGRSGVRCGPRRGARLNLKRFGPRRGTRLNLERLGPRRGAVEFEESERNPLGPSVTTCEETEGVSAVLTELLGVASPCFGIWFVFIVRISLLGTFLFCSSSAWLAAKSQRAQNALGLPTKTDFARG